MVTHHFSKWSEAAQTETIRNVSSSEMCSGGNPSFLPLTWDCGV